MADTLTLPAWLWARVAAFLASGKSGRVVLFIDRGVITSADIHERMRA